DRLEQRIPHSALDKPSPARPVSSDGCTGKPAHPDVGTASGASLVPEVGQPVLVEPEVVPELVEDGDPDLAFQLGRVAKRLLERAAVDRDRVRAVVAALVEPEEVRVVGVLILDDDGDVLEAAGEVGRKRVERTADVRVEAHR